MLERKGVKVENKYNDNILEMSGINKSFSGVAVLKDVQLNVKKGTVHALMGENGAGKSTLMKILLGIYSKDSGKIIYDGKEVFFNNPRQALDNGIAMIHQELSTVRDLKVYENIFLGKEIKFGRCIIKNDKAMIDETRNLFESIGINISANVKMGSLSVAMQSMCEIAKAVSYNAKLIIMDEPTSALTEQEVEMLFKIIKKLKNNGISIIYISHKMDEIFEICDELTVFRDGRYIDSFPVKGTTRNELIRLMVGRSIENLFPKETVPIGDVYLKVDNLTKEGEFEDVSFEVRKGEIFGIAGLVGAGRTELAETIFGVRKKTGGKVFVNGKEVNVHSPRDAIKAGMSLVTEDRKLNGCFLPLSVKQNIIMASLGKYAKASFVNRRKVKATSEKMVEEMKVKTASIETLMKNLSGGNQQKVLIARWLLNDPDILIFDEPTRGIDVGSKEEIYKLLAKFAEAGKCIIMISSELPEVMGISDRILVMHEGTATGILNRDEFSQDKIMKYATNTIDE